MTVDASAGPAQYQKWIPLGALSSVRKAGLSISVTGFILSLALLWRACSFIWGASQAQGTIIDRSDDRGTFTIQFRIDDRAYRFDEALPSSHGSSARTRRQLVPGTVIPVLYDPGSPSHAKWKNNRIWLFPLFLSVMFLLGIRASRDPRFSTGFASGMHASEF
jgi:hypothetical protein